MHGKEIRVGYPRKRRQWLAGVAGLGSVATIAGNTAARSVRRRSIIDDPYSAEDFQAPIGDRSCVVSTSDGVPLAVREVGPVHASLTVVFVHGFCLRMEAFHFQRKRLSQEWGSQIRMVFYDQRGHGRSGTAEPDTYTLTQLGSDLEAVLRVTAPRGPIVLVGHSMGGMTVLAHARQYPQHYGTKIAGAVIISSAAEGVAESPLGEILKNPALQAVRFTARSAPKLAHRGRHVSRALIDPILRAASYGDSHVSPTVVTFSHDMMYRTSITTLVEFLQALEVHDETAALTVLAQIPTLIVCGDHDLVTPDKYARKMAAALPRSELLIVAQAGHLALLGKPDAVNDGLVRLIERVKPTRWRLRGWGRRFG